MIMRRAHPLSISFLRLTAIPKSLFSPSLSCLYSFHSRFYTCSSSSSSSSSSAAQIQTQSSNETPKTTQHHPWPEWISFIDRLKSYGYFRPPSSSSSSTSSSDIGYAEITTLKDPCLSFARDRFDLFRSLSKGDIHILVEGGCPKLQRKVVNSGKRLRVYVGLEEKNVCNMCSLQGSCDRAYVVLGESEGVARMVDVMRLLLSYALDPVLISGASSSQSIQQAESASRRLLSLLIKLSEAPTGLAPSESAKKLTYKKEQSVKTYREQFVGVMDASLSQDVEKKKEDWTCPKCSFVNFSRNTQCRKCNEKGPKRGSVDVEMKKGDWKCPQCACINFASRRNCFQCKESRPPRILQPGEWECSKCDFLNFRRNITCLKCGNERSKVVPWQEN